MNILRCSLAAVVVLLGSTPGWCDEVHTPKVGSAERKEIMDTLRGEYTTGSGANVKFQVKHLKVHNGWAWVNVVPLDPSGKPEGEEWPSLLQQKGSKWVFIDLIAIAAAIDDPVGPMDPSAKFLKAVQKKHPGVPSDIFPKSGK